MAGSENRSTVISLAHDLAAEVQTILAVPSGGVMRGGMYDDNRARTSIDNAQLPASAAATYRHG
jgi:hypothetical protein